MTVNINIEIENIDYISNQKDNLIYQDKHGELYENDNLDWLINNQEKYKNKIKMIYIDPPYNTKNNNFIYKDNMSHYDWLNFMYPRLKLAKELLTDDGVIFVSIDDNEQAYLKVLMDEVFGRDNFVTNFLWEKSCSNLSKFYRNNFEYIICYIKNKNKYNKKFIGNKSDKVGSSSLLNGNSNKYQKLIFPKNSINFKFCINGILSKIKYNDLEIHNDIIIKDNYNDNEVLISGHFKWNQNKLTNEINNKTLITSNTDKLRLRYEKNDVVNIVTPYKYLSKSIGINQKNNDDTIFTYPKPITLIKYLINMVDLNTHDIVLDFFAGSGTTGCAVIDLNKTNNTDIKYILIQNDELINNNKISNTTISNITKLKLMEYYNAIYNKS